MLAKELFKNDNGKIKKSMKKKWKRFSCKI